MFGSVVFGIVLNVQKPCVITNTEKKVMINPTANENGKNEFPKEIMSPSLSKISRN